MESWTLWLTSWDHHGSPIFQRVAVTGNLLRSGWRKLDFKERSRNCLGTWIGVEVSPTMLQHLQHLQPFLGIGINMLCCLQYHYQFWRLTILKTRWTHPGVVESGLYKIHQKSTTRTSKPNRRQQKLSDIIRSFFALALAKMLKIPTLTIIDTSSSSKTTDCKAHGAGDHWARQWGLDVPQMELPGARPVPIPLDPTIGWLWSVWSILL